MKLFGWSLVVAWFAYLAFLGPFLISARDWFLVGLGVALLIALIYGTWKFAQLYLNRKERS